MGFCIFLITVLAVISVDAQVTGPPTFEVASVKRSQSSVRGASLTSNPGRWSCVNCSLFSIFTHAFAVFEYQIVAPEWTRTAKFDLVAKLPEGAKREDFSLMLKSLLDERLKLQAHHESREVPVYELILARGGPKIKQVTEPAPPLPTGPRIDRDGYPNVPNGSGWQALDGRGRIQFRGQTMANVAHYISIQVDRPVIDSTGLKGKYALTLSFRLLAHNANGISTADPSNAALGPRIYEAVNEQLGLMLKPARRPIEFVIIDHVDRIPIVN